MPEKHPAVLIEQWLPIAEIGAESQRERGASSALPPLYFLHVWWARRPLLTSRAAVLGSVLPAWSPDWPSRLREQFPTDESYRHWFKRLLGILGDPVAGRKLIQYAKDKNIKLPGNPYGYPRAFTVNPDENQIRTLQDLLEHTWGTRDISVMDPMAGGGSIPFEALRYGFASYANEFNPVASVILKATLEYPFKFGPELATEIEKYGGLMAREVEQRLGLYFPRQKGESILAYVWARTIRCPYTGKPVPLSPNWWLQKGGELVAGQPIFTSGAHEARFEIVRGKTACERAKPDVGTVRQGDGISPWAHNQAIPGDHIKAEAQAGEMGQQLYALGIRGKNGKGFRAPTEEDLEAIKQAEAALKKKLPGWEAKGLIPVEQIPEGNKTSEPLRYGMRRWSEIFSPRQLLALATYLEVFYEVTGEVRKALPDDRAKAVVTYLALALDKCADYNSRMTRWHSGRGVIANTFDRHDFGFKWSHAEFDAAHNLLPWTVSQVVDAYTGISKLAESARSPLFSVGSKAISDRVAITIGNAASLNTIPDRSIGSLCVDPPYKANVMYAECSDFFYVWMKRTLAEWYPGFFTDELSNKDDEAVPNVARFAGIGGAKSKKELADQDYERKMAACFREMYRVLRDDGVLTVMFTHKEVSAWDNLATALIGAGFGIKASWPVHTESEHSLHQAKKNAAASTILLVCRKREPSKDPIWWDDLKNKVRGTARAKAEEFEKQGIRGVDLYISTFGPTLSIISEHWPVLTGDVDPKTGQPKPLRPDVALDLARQEVVDLRKRDLLLGRTVQFDRATDWYLMAWDAFQAEQFPADEARKLAIALDINLEEVLIKTKRIISKKQNFVVLQPPTARRKKGMVDPELTAFDSQLDAVHTAMLVFEEDGARACERFLRQAHLLNDATFKACLQALINAVPRTKKKGKFVRPEAALLDRLRDAFFQDLQVPPEEAPPALPSQQAFGFAKAAEDVEEYGEEEDREEAEEE
jgi:adenine-specific DNA methylase